MKADRELLRHLRRLARCALVADKEWPRAAIRFIGPLFPTCEMKAFPPDQRDLAMRWAEELPQAPERSPAFRFLATSREDVLAFEIDGVISSEEMPAVIRTFEAFLARHQKVRLLNRVKHFGGIDPAVLLQDGLVPVKLAAIRKLERYAIVGAPDWMRKLAQAVSPALAIEIRTFATDQEDAAWAWLGAEPAR